MVNFGIARSLLDQRNTADRLLIRNIPGRVLMMRLLLDVRWVCYNMLLSSHMLLLELLELLLLNGRQGSRGYKHLLWRKNRVQLRINAVSFGLEQLLSAKPRLRIRCTHLICECLRRYVD